MMKSTQLERIPLHSWATSQDDPGQHEHRAVAHERGARDPEKDTRTTSAEASTEAVLEQCHRRIRQRNHEDQERDGKGRGGHPFRAQEQKPTGGDDAHVGERHQGEAVVDAQASAPRDGCGERRHADRPLRIAAPIELRYAASDLRRMYSR